MKKNETSAITALLDALSDTPLHYACEYGHSDVVRLLLEHGANMSLSDDNDWTPLDRACEQGFPNIVRLLLDHGAEVNDWDEGGRTPLHVACLYGRSDVVRLLLEKGADVNAKSMTGWSALDYTLDLPPDEPSREEIMDLFRQYAPEAVMEAYCTQSPQS